MSVRRTDRPSLVVWIPYCFLQTLLENCKKVAPGKKEHIYYFEKPSSWLLLKFRTVQCDKHHYFIVLYYYNYMVLNTKFTMKIIWNMINCKFNTSFNTKLIIWTKMRQEIEHEFPFKVFHWISLDDQGFSYQNNLIYKVIFIKPANSS